MATVTHRNTTANSNNATSYTTTSFTPTAGVLLAFCAILGAAVEDLGDFTASASANGITFTRIGAWERGGIDTMILFVADQLVPGSPSAMTCTVNNPQDAGTGGIMFVTEIGGMTNVGAAAVRQFDANNGAGGGTPSASFTLAPLAGNPQLGYLQNVSNPSGVTSPAGFVNESDTGYSTPTKGGRYSSLAAGGTTQTVTWGSTSASAWAVMIVAFDASGGGPPPSSFAAFGVPL